MTKIVAKFGGTSVADIARIERAAEKIAREYKNGNSIAVVVSAMAGVTNQLVDYCQDISPMHDAREYDVVVSSGEQVTAGLMAMVLQKKGIPSRSWMGWQIPIVCDDMHGKSRIVDIEAEEFEKRIADGEVPVLAGFQGITRRHRIATLGRGGSDTTAVALAAAIKAERCDIYTDVDGVFTTDPRIVPEARKIGKISYEEMLELASLGAKVLQTRSVEMAMKWDVPVQVLSSFGDRIGSEFPGTLVTREEDIVEHEVVNGIAHSRDETKVTFLGLPDVPGIAAKVFGPLSKANVNVDMIVQNVSADGKFADLTFTVTRADFERALKAIKEGTDIDDSHISIDDKVAKVSVVGIGMNSHAGVAQKMFKTLSDKGINIQVISTSEIKISVLIAEEYTELAVRSLHEAYGLGDK